MRSSLTYKPDGTSSSEDDEDSPLEVFTDSEKYLTTSDDENGQNDEEMADNRESGLVKEDSWANDKLSLETDRPCTTLVDTEV